MIYSISSIVLLGLFIIALIGGRRLMKYFHERRNIQAYEEEADESAKIPVFDTTDDPLLVNAVLNEAIKKRSLFKVMLNNRGNSFSSSPVMLESTSMLIDALFPKEGNELIPDAQFISVEFIVKQIAPVPFNFTSLFMGREIFNNYPALRIALPKTIQRDQKRNYHRVELSADDPVYLQCTIDDNPVIVKASNISGGGIGFYANFGKSALCHGRQLDFVTITIPEPVVIERLSIVYVESQVHYPVVIDGKPYHYYYGAEFSGIDPLIREKIIQFVIEKERAELKKINALTSR